MMCCPCESSGSTMVAVSHLLYTIGGSDDRVAMTDVDMVDTNLLPCEWIAGPSLNIPR
jgi:hypothetical protein